MNLASTVKLVGGGGCGYNSVRGPGFNTPVLHQINNKYINLITPTKA